jgi:hypothetical protein
VLIVWYRYSVVNERCKGESMKYSVHMISETGSGCYLSVKGRTEWKTKKCAIRHAKDIADTKTHLFGCVIVEVENEFGEVVKTFTKKEHTQS